MDKLKPEGGMVGFFGKVPTYGDFISAGIQQGFQQVFDRWLQQGIRTSQKQLEDDWLNAYRQGPIWCFALGKDVCGPLSVAGVMMPSLDRVGRYFPIVIVGQSSDPNATPDVLAADEAWFEAAEALIATTLDPDFNLADFASKVAGLRPPMLSEELVDSGSFQQSTPATSYWWTKAAGTGAPKSFVSEGLPPPEDFKYLLLPARRSSSAPPADKKPEQPQSFARLRKQISLRSAYSSHPGTRAVFNSDSVFISGKPHIYSIADGVGEGSEGNSAAKLASQALAKVLDHDSLEDLYLDTKGKLGLAHGVLRSASENAGRRALAASIVTLVSAGDQCAIISAGDARCYLMRDGLLRILTRDHIEIGIRKRLTNGIGGIENFVPDVIVKTLIDGDRLLLCSAALPRVLTEAAIAELLLSSEDINSVVTALIHDCLIMSVKEGVSAIVLEAVAT